LRRRSWRAVLRVSIENIRRGVLVTTEIVRSIGALTDLAAVARGPEVCYFRSMLLF
jgi:hypothetical protein